MTAPSNPFPVSAYHGPDLFCDRADEVKRLYANAMNGVDTTLLSIRRMGKTGLVQHLFHKLAKKQKVYCLYMDIYSTQNQKEFINLFSTAVLQAFPPKKSIGKKVLGFLQGLRLTISYDELTGRPDASLNYSQPKQYEQSLASQLAFIEKLGVTVIVAIDEFQQISHYPEKNTEAMLRTLVQPLKNIRFIFSGSSKHVLLQMFTSSKRPFFGSTQLLELKNIDQSTYEAFIEGSFKKYKRRIEPDALKFISSWTRLHTYYTQAVCNRLFAEGYKNITLPLVLSTCGRLLDEQESTFFQYRNLLTAAQWQLLKAIAKEDKLYQPNSMHFLTTYKIGTASHVQRGLEALLTKEMIYTEKDERGNYYSVYDCFLSRWLKLAID